MRSVQRPRIHFAPEKGWMNDPNGPVYAGGEWHLFYQYNPFGSEWGNICWAYATSRDLVDWTRRGVRLAPMRESGEQWCFSGCTVPLADGFALLYTSVGFEENAARDSAVQRICACDRDFAQIRRIGTMRADVNPFPVTEWRDPFVFGHGGKKYLLLAGVAEGRGNILLYEAADERLVTWKYVSRLFSREGDILECPNAAVYGDTMLLYYSSVGENRVRYAVGRFDGRGLTVRGEGIADYGENCFYATNLARGKDGRDVLFAWQKESLLHGASPDGTYSGCLALPRTVTLLGDTPVYAFADAFGKLRGKELERTGNVIRSDAVSARLVFRTHGCGEAVLADTGAARIRLIFWKECLRVEREGTPCGDTRVITLPAREENRVEVIADGTLFEMLVNGSETVSFRFYAKERTRVLFSAADGFVTDLSGHELLPAQMTDEEEGERHV